MNETRTLPSPLLKIVDYSAPGGWSVGDRAERARGYCERLEKGGILFFAGVPFELPEADRQFLLSQKQRHSRFHKNISYKPERDRLHGSKEDTETSVRLHEVMRRYSRAVQSFVDGFLLPYAGQWKLDYASFRPLEEQGRKLPLHKRNDLLHFDAFPTRPTRGGRILRVFTNVNPSASRVWLTGEPFQEATPKLAHAAALERFRSRRLAANVAHALASVGLPISDRSPYDRFMLHFHDWLKENTEFQRQSPQVRIEFPPACTWLVYTDGVPHAVLSGQYALEQTFIIPREALVAPDASPIAVLEKLAGTKMA